MSKVVKEFRYAVNGFDVRTFSPGEQDLPPDAEAYGRSEGFVQGGAHEQKARDSSPENKAHTKHSKKKGR
jgi:hypothetical protein